MIDLAIMRAELIRDEGAKQYAYDDATGRLLRPGVALTGNPTVGIGRCLSTKGLSNAEQIYLLDNDITEYLADLDPLPWFAGLDPTRQRAIVNMRHQLGLEGVLEFRHMIAALARQDWPDAVAAGLDSDWAREDPKRANRVLGLLLDPSQPAQNAPYVTLE